MNKKRLPFTIRCIIHFLLFICFISDGDRNTAAQTVRKVWETKRIFEIPESVLYDPDSDIVYVSNINGEPTAEDGNGFISKLGLNGEIVVLEWINGLNAPKGMGLYKGKRFVTDIDRVVEIDIEMGKIMGEYTTPKAQFLNDISVHSSGIVFVSDNMANIIFRLKDGKLIPWLESPEVNMPNGLWAEEEHLLIGINNSVLRVDFRTKNVICFIQETGFIDGLVSSDKGRYFMSNPTGFVYMVQPEKERIKIVDTTAEKVISADIDFILGMRMPLVPTFIDNWVMGYEVRE